MRHSGNFGSSTSSSSIGSSSPGSGAGSSAGTGKLTGADQRRLEVLRAIVEDFVTTSEPVGSNSLISRHQLGVSSATIRNDMAMLEELGYIEQPHTSAGRVPTDKGYRLFVDQLVEVRPLSAAQRRAIDSFLGTAVDLDDVMVSTVRLLSQLTRQVAVVQYPSLTRSSVQHVELVELGLGRLLLVMIAETGRVEQRVVMIPALSSEDISSIRAELNQRVAGHAFVDVSHNVQDLGTRFSGPARAAVAAIVATLLETVVERSEERVMVGGTRNLARAGGEFSRDLEPILSALEEQMVLLQLLSEQTESTAHELAVTIGHENAELSLASASVVTAGYGNDGHEVARLGIVGPTRMDYPGTMTAVRAVARYVGRLIHGAKD